MNITEMLNNVQFLVDNEGNRKSVVLEYRLWEKLSLFFDDVRETKSVSVKKKSKSFLKTARSLNWDGDADWSKEYQNRKLLEAINAAHSDLPDKEDLFLQEKIRDKQRELVENEW